MNGTKIEKQRIAGPRVMHWPCFALNGKVVVNWTLQDQFTFLQQIGYPPPEITSAQFGAAQVIASGRDP